MITRLITVSDLFEMHRNIESICCIPGANIALYVGQLYFKNKQTNKKKLMGKEIRFVVTRSAEWDQLNENSQKVQTSNYKINKC